MAAPGKCILVTGPPGVGKTTLIMRVLESLKSSNPNLKIHGFYTREIRNGNERVGFEVVTVGGQRAPLASINSSRLSNLQGELSGSWMGRLSVEELHWQSKRIRLKTDISTYDEYIIIFFLDHSPESVRWPCVGRYRVDVASFESVALPELQIKEDTDLFVIDEVGKMELYSSSFLPAVLRILDSNIPVLASIPIPKQGRDIPGVTRVRNHPRAVVYTLNQSNRDMLRERIYSQLV